MNILKDLRKLREYYIRTRQVGHTTLMEKGLRSVERKIVLVHDRNTGEKIAKDLGKPITHVTLHRLDLDAFNHPLAIDNAAMYVLLDESIKKIEALEHRIKKSNLKNQIKNAPKGD